MRLYFLKQYVIRFGLVCFVFSLGAAQGQTTLTGYQNTTSLPNYDADEAYALLDEWMGLIDPNLDALPSARETEIYQELVRGERSTSLVTSFDFNNKFANDGMYMWGVAEAIVAATERIELAKDLAWLPTALDHTDEMLALRDPAGTESLNHGGPLLEPVWLSPHLSSEGTMSPLNVGHNGTFVARFANWILEHPELYSQTAPANPVIPLSVPTTYYGRAKFYLTEMKRSIEEEDRAGMFWAFDTTNHVGWVFQNDEKDGSDLAALYPSGISVTNILSVSNMEDIGLHPYNRTLFYLASRLETAKGLQMIDIEDSTTVHTAFINNVMEQCEQALNYWRYHRVTYVEAGPEGTSFTWPYSGSQDSTVYNEDTIHFGMDVDPLKSFLDILSSDDLEGTTGTIYSRWFDHESHVYFREIEPELGLDEVTGLPENFTWNWGPSYLDWIGGWASSTQMQGSAMKALEVFKERMRRADFDLSFREQYLARDDTRRSRNMMGPFQLYDLKMARAARGLTPTAGTHSPVFQPVSPSTSFSVPESTPLGTVIGSVSATDADAGQSLHYWISGGNIGNRFKIDPVTGDIRVNNYYALNDEEEGALTPLEITVMDDGVPVRMATTTVNISLEDTNASPTFPAGQTGRFTSNLIKGDPVMVVNASDTSDLRFFIETGTSLFTIDADTGVIRIKDSAVAANCSVGSTYTLQIAAMETTDLPLITRETVEITCEASFGDSTASVTSGTVPFSVNFNSTQTSGGSVVSTAWDFGDGGTAGTASTSHTYTTAGTYEVQALIQDERGEIDRQTVQVVAQGSGPIPDGLLAHYRFSEGSGTTALDSSGNANHATLTGDAYDADGFVGTGLELRDEVLTISSAIYSTFDEEITLSLFLRGDADFHPYNTPFKAVDASGNRVVSTHMPWGGEGGNYIWDAGNVGTSFDRVSSSAPIPAAGEWNHWVFTKNAGTGAMAIYTNGVLLVSGTGKTKSMTDITSFKFGGSNYKGTIDEICIYDKALSSTEVADLYADISASQVYSRTYSAGANGSIRGVAAQTVGFSGNGTAVTAVPNAGYSFLGWSDGRTDNPRVDLNVVANLAVSALFSSSMTEQKLVADVANSSPSGYGGSVANTVNDTFGYSPDGPTAALPVQAWNGADGFHAQLSDGVDAVLVYSLTGGALTLAAGSTFAVDLYGRDMLNDRCQDIDIELYSGGFGGTQVATVTGVAISETDPWYVRATLTPTAAFDTVVVIGHDTTADGGNLFTLMEIRAAVSQIPNQDSDGDGLTDAQETALGTDPNDPDSGFGIDGLPLPTFGKIQITWPSATGVLYKVWKSPDLTHWSTARDWATAQTPPADMLEFNLSPSNGYFKVEAAIQ